MSAELNEKTARLVDVLAVRGPAAVLINSQPNFAWISCGGSNGIDLSREGGAAAILVCNDGRRFIIANNIEMPRMLAEVVSAADFEAIEFPWQQEKAEPGLVLALARSVSDGPVVVEHEVEREIDACRFSLTDAEVERYQAVGRDAGEALGRVAARLRPDMSESEVAELMRAELAAEQLRSVVTLVAADERISRFRHPVPTAKCWKRELLLVTCVRRGGLTASLSRMISLGEPRDELMQKTEAAAFVNACLLYATVEGATGSALYAAAKKAYAERGFGGEIDLHHQGGATGYRTRDWVAHEASTDTVRRRQAFAWNPSITGTKVEDTVIADGDMAEVLTTTPGFPTILNMIGERQFTATGILSI